MSRYVCSYNMKERVDSEQTVNDDSDKEAIKSDLNHWSQNILQ